MGIIVKKLNKKFGDFKAVDNVSFEVEQGKLMVLLGPSGSGKSTILRMIAGLEIPDSGEIYLTGEDAAKLPAQKRGVGFVFQHYALFRHMTVKQNVAFGLEVKKAAKPEIDKRVKELLDLVQLSGYANHYPTQLSGGQRQRVALARALAPQPKVLLLDEPFGALDAKVREELRHWIRRLHDEVHLTSLFVTHDQNEAMELSDKIIVINQGRVEQIGKPQEIYEHPRTSFVAGFLGPVNILQGEVQAGKVSAGGFEFDLSQKEVHREKDSVEALIRPSDIALRKVSGEDLPSGIVKRISFLGWGIKVEVVLSDGQPLIAHVEKEEFKSLGLTLGQEVFIEPRKAKVFNPSNTQDFSI